MSEIGEGYKPTEIKIETNHQKSLNCQLKKLDQSRPDHQVFSSVLKEIYQEYETLDLEASKADNIRYQPKCALGIYEYVPVIDAVDNIPDPYNIFPKIEIVVKNSKDLSNSEITKKIAETISNNTDIPTIVEPFEGFDQPYDKLENGNIYYHSKMEDTFGIHTKQYELTPNGIDFKNRKGDVILINELKVDDPAVIKTGIHELGHIVEEKMNKENTEVISTIYGIKAGLLMAEIDPQKSADMIRGQVHLYNWILTGTVAP